MRGSKILTTVLVLAFLGVFFLLAQPVWACIEAGTCGGGYSPGNQVDQGCAANGCGVGTRRICTCYAIPSGGNPPVCPNQSQWGCACVADAACGGGGGGGGGGAPPPPPPPPACSVSNPATALLTGPADGATVPSNKPLLTWTTRGWGSGCPNNNALYIQYKVFDGVSCTNGAWTGVAASTVSGNGRIEVQWNTTYCWRVVKSNGSRTSVSAIQTFTTALPSTLDNFSFSGGNKCTGGAYTGRITGNAVKDSEINNPLTYSVTGSKTDPAGTLQEVVVVMVSDAYLATLTNATLPVDGNTNFLFMEHALRFAHDPTNRRNSGFRAANIETGTGSFATVDRTTAPFFGTAYTGGGVTNAAGTIRVRDLNTAGGSRVSFAGLTGTATGVVQYQNTYANTPLHVYVAVIERKSDGIVTSQSPYPGTATAYDDNLILERVQDWNIDMTPPTVSISEPAFSTPDNYSVTWNISDNTALQDVRSYCYFLASANATVQDTVAGLPISLDATPKGFDVIADNLITTPAPNTDTSVPDMVGNCLINAAGTFNRSYQLTAGALSEPLGLEAYAKDAACNVTVGTQNSAPPTPWITAYLGSVSANGGITNMEIPTSVANTTSVAGFSMNGNSFLSSFLALSGTIDNAQPANNVSKARVHAANYVNQAANPQDHGYDTWYALFRDAVIKSGNAITPIPSTRNTYNNNIAGFYGRAGSTYGYFEHTGDVLMPSTGYRCNMRAVIFINGNLTIQPNFTRAGLNTCVFVVSGDIIVEPGLYRSAGRGVNAISAYDFIEGIFVTDGAFRILPDERVSPQINDGLRVIGAVYANDVVLGRVLKPAQTPLQPSEIFTYDPWGLYLFRNVLKLTEYSLREY